MSQSTRFAGLTELDPGDPLSTDGAAFQGHDRTIIDHYLELGAKTHRHDAHPGLADPDTEPALIITGTPGTIAGGLSITVGFTLVDEDRGETAISPLASLTMPDVMSPPVSAPAGSADYSGGQLRADTYYYAKTWIDGAGGETTIGPRAAVQRMPGHASGQIGIAGLTTGMALASAAGWRLYKSVAGGVYKFLAQGMDDSLIDDGTICADCVTEPPTVNTTSQENSFAVTVGSALASAAQTFRIYGGVGQILDPGLLGEYTLASAGVPIEFTSLALSRGRPPRISTSIGGANQIDPDTDILEWHWKRPVSDSAALPAGEWGDVRLALADGSLWGVLASAGAVDPSDWTAIGGGGGGGGGGTWKDPVAIASLLPEDDNTYNDVRVVQSSGRAYLWQGAWVPVWPDPYDGGAADPHWKAPVANQGALPGGDSDGDIRLSLAEGILWRWDGSAWKAIAGNHEAWVVPTLLNSWTDLNPGNSSVQVAFYRDRQRVYCRGLIKLGSNGNEIFHLPAGYIPPGDVRIAVPQMDFVGTAAATLCVVHVTNAGQVVTEDYTSPRVVALDGVSWPLS